MPLNPHVKGGDDVPVTDGGTGSSTGGGALTNLGGLDETAHDVLDHTGLMGVGDLTVAAHASTDHSAILGAGGDGETESVATQASGATIIRVVPGGTLAVDGESLEFTLWGVLQTSGNFTVTWDGQTILPFITSSAGEFTVRGTIVRTGAATQEITASITPSFGSSGEGQRTAGTATLSGAITLAVASSLGTINFNGLVVRKWAA